MKRGGTSLEIALILGVTIFLITCENPPSNYQHLQFVQWLIVAVGGFLGLVMTPLRFF